MPKRTKARGRSDDGNAFIPESDQRTGTRDELAEELAERHQRAVITGGATDDDRVDDVLADEMGGSYVVSGASVEFGDTAEDSQGSVVGPDVEQNPLPQAVGPLAIASLEEERDAVEAREEETGDADLPDPDAEEESRWVPEPPEVRRKAGDPAP